MTGYSIQMFCAGHTMRFAVKITGKPFQDKLNCEDQSRVPKKTWPKSTVPNVAEASKHLQHLSFAFKPTYKTRWYWQTTIGCWLHMSIWPMFKPWNVVPSKMAWSAGIPIVDSETPQSILDSILSELIINRHLNIFEHTWTLLNCPRTEAFVCCTLLGRGTREVRTVLWHTAASRKQKPDACAAWSQVACETS